MVEKSAGSVGGRWQSSCINNAAGWLARSLRGSALSAPRPAFVEGTFIPCEAREDEDGDGWEWLQSPGSFALPWELSWGRRVGVRRFAIILGLLVAWRASGGGFAQCRIWVRSRGFAP